MKKFFTLFAAWMIAAITTVASAGNLTVFSKAQFAKNLSSAAGNASEIINVMDDDATLADGRNSVGIFQITGTDETYKIVIGISSTEFAGHYEINNLKEEYCTVQEVATGDYYKITAADINVTEEDDILHLTGDITDQLNRRFHVDFTVDMSDPVDEDIDETEADLTTSFAANEVQVDKDPSSPLVALSGINADNHYITLYFVGLQSTDIPVGTYPLDHPSVIPTGPCVLSTTGLVEGMPMPNGSFTAMVENGGLTRPLYFIASGNVVVSENAGVKTVLVNAKNTHDKNINITITLPSVTPTGISQVDAKAYTGVSKVVENGKIVISKNGKKFNVAGGRIK